MVAEADGAVTVVAAVALVTVVAAVVVSVIVAASAAIVVAVVEVSNPCDLLRRTSRSQQGEGSRRHHRDPRGARSVYGWW